MRLSALLRRATGPVLLVALTVPVPVPATPAEGLVVVAPPAETSTTGTASTVSPSTVATGGTLSYTLSGFPRGVTVQVLIDDGTLAPADDAAHGVVMEVTVSASGTSSGAFELPAYVSEGQHWLRFRVSAGQDVPASPVRTLDYTNRSPLFTVGAVTVIGGANPVASSTPTPTSTPRASTSPTGTSVGATTAPPSSSGDFPVVGASVLIVAVALATTGVGVSIHRRRLVATARVASSSQLEATPS